MWKILLFITIIMGCTTATVATITKYDVTPMGICIIFLLMATCFIAMIEND